MPKGLVHYYFRRKADLLGALIKRLPDEQLDPAQVVVPGDIAESLRRLVSELDARLDRSRMLSHLLWREADTHRAVRDALNKRFQQLVRQVRTVILAAGEGGIAVEDVDSAAGLLALALSYRHSVARHGAPELMEGELNFIADALIARPVR